MLQERTPLLGATVELVQSVTIALLVALFAVAVLAAAIFGFAWGKAKIATEKLRAWYAEIATRRVMNDARRSQRVPVTADPPPATLRSGPPRQPMKPSDTPQPPPLPTIPIGAPSAGITSPGSALPPPAPPRVPPRPRPLTSAVELAQTSPDWSDDHRKTQRHGSPQTQRHGSPPARRELDDPSTRKTTRNPRPPRAGSEVRPDELDFSDADEPED